MKGTTASIAIVIVLIGGVFMLGRNKPQKIEDAEPVFVEGGMSLASQVVEIDAKGGYSPQLISAKAGIPTTLKIITRGTFDCSAALTIPSIGYRTNLPPTGETLIEVPPQDAGTSLEGICQMGMYSFAINFD